MCYEFFFDFQVHVSNESRCADHCSQFALSDARDAKFAAAECSHDHNHFCDRCVKLDKVF
jgi:hypothetical protein